MSKDKSHPPLSPLQPPFFPCTSTSSCHDPLLRLPQELFPCPNLIPVPSTPHTAARTPHLKIKIAHVTPLVKPFQELSTVLRSKPNHLPRESPISNSLSALPSRGAPGTADHLKQCQSYPTLSLRVISLPGMPFPPDVPKFGSTFFKAQLRHHLQGSFP